METGRDTVRFVGQYFLNMAMAFDQFASTLLGGHPDDTISQRLGRAKVSARESGRSPSIAIRTSVIIVDFLAYLLAREKNHCEASLGGKTRALELWNWGGSRSMSHVEDSL